MATNIKKFKILIFFSICLGLSLSQAYSISGTVLDYQSNKPIVNVNIFIENTVLGTVTDENGLFLLYLNDQKETNIILNIKMIGYEQQILNLELLEKNNNLGEIYLKHKSLELESIHIHSHKKKSQQISDISLSGQKLNDNLTANIATTLSNQPNIGVNSFGAVISKPVLRGYSGDRFLLTKDGNKTGDLSQSSIDHVITLDMSEVNKIEVIRGPKSLVFGSNAIGGVINTTIAGNPKLRVNKIFSKFLFGGESFNKGAYSNMMIFFPLKNNQINILFSNRKTDSQTSPKGKLENTYSNISNYKLGYTKYNQKSYVNFIFENHDMEYGVPPYGDGHENGIDITLEKKTFQANYHQDISFFKFDQFDFKYNLIDYGHKEFEKLYGLGVALNKRTNTIKLEFHSLNTVLGSELDYRQFSSGGYHLTPHTNELTLSLYGFNEIEFSSFSLLSSLRLSSLSIKPNEYNYNNLDNELVKDKSFNYFSSSIGFKKIINKFEINSWIMNTMRAPRVEELYSDGPHLGTYSYEIGEPNLKLEKIYGIESSILYDFNPLSISLTTFYNHSPYYHQMNKIGNCEQEYILNQTHPCYDADFIAWGSGPINWLYKYQTKGVKSLVKGLEFNLNYHYQNFKIRYDFSLVRGTDLTNRIPLSYINPDKQILTLEYQKELMHYKLRLSKMHSQNKLGEFESYTPSSFLVDLILSYRRDNHNMTIQVNNILNEEYYNHLSKIKSIMPEAGRNVTIAYKIFF